MQSDHAATTLLFVGRAGVGKSSLINILCESLKENYQEVTQAGRGVEPTTIEVGEYQAELRGMRVTLIDTPGVYSSSLDEGFEGLEVQKEISAFVIVLSMARPMDFLDNNSLKVFYGALCGGTPVQSIDDVFQHAIFVFTRSLSQAARGMTNQDVLADNMDQLRQVLIHLGVCEQTAQRIPFLAVDYLEMSTECHHDFWQAVERVTRGTEGRKLMFAPGLTEPQTATSGYLCV